MAYSSSLSKTSRRLKYIYDLPPSAFLSLCRILDQERKWEELGGYYMGFDMHALNEFGNAFYHKESPTNKMLTAWGNGNHTIEELFVFFAQMGHKRAMSVLKDYVNPKYHNLLHSRDQPVWTTGLSREPTETSIYSWTSGNDAATNPAAASEKVPVQDGDNESQMQGASGQANGFTPTEKSILSADKNAMQQEEALEAPAKKLQSEPQNNAVYRNFMQQEVDVVRRPIREKQSLVQNAVGGDLPKLPNAVVVKAEAVEEGDVLCPMVANTTLTQKDQSVSCSLEVNTKSTSPLVSCSDSNIPFIQYEELVQATNNFDPSKVLGKGGFGVVYKGVWKRTVVAVKRIVKRNNPGLTSMEEAKLLQSYVELRALTWYRHDNILMLYGYSEHDNELCLVCQYMINGSLEDRLQRRNKTAALPWMQRLKIACGSARGIQFLHTCEKPLIHGDIKSANILLDANLEAKIGDFGLARKGPENQQTHTLVTSVHGTSQYLPPEYLRSHQLSTKVDTYSFGIVLFEIATGQQAYDEQRNKGKEHLIAYVLSNTDGHVIRDNSAGHEDIEVFEKLIELGKCCTSQRKKCRPEMEQVLSTLDDYMMDLKLKSKVPLSRAPEVDSNFPKEEAIVRNPEMNISVNGKYMADSRATWSSLRTPNIPCISALGMTPSDFMEPPAVSAKGKTLSFQTRK